MEDPLCASFPLQREGGGEDRASKVSITEEKIPLNVKEIIPGVYLTVFG